MKSKVKRLNVHIPESLDKEIKKICNERKAKGMPATMRIIVLEFLQNGVNEYLKSKQERCNVSNTLNEV